MHLDQNVLSLSPTDLANHLACPHLTELNLAKVHGLAEPPNWHDPMVEILRKRGDEHEAAYLQHLASQGIPHVRIGHDRSDLGTPDSGLRTPDHSPFATTIEAMKAGAPAIVQAPLGEGRWQGRADVLLRVEKPSKVGNYSYEVVDTKLARETKGGTILQLCLYTELVCELQGVMPEFMYVVSPGKGFEPECFRVSDYLAYYRMVKRELVEAVRVANDRHSREGGNPGSHDARGNPDYGSDAVRETASSSDEWRVSTTDDGPRTTDLYPEPCEHCAICRWWKRCNDVRRSDDHLTFVAAISKSQIGELKKHDVDTLAKLAVLETPLQWKPERGSRESIERVHEQARLQEKQRTKDEPVYELLPRVENEGLARLPEPSEADIFFDLESARFVGEHGLQYLWGIADRQRNYLTYEEDWAGSAAEERASFERFMDFVMQQWKAFPDLHVYHFGHYEPTTLKQLAQRYATREEELDTLLRAEVFVDLHSIVKQSLIAGVEQYSLKDLEQFFGYEREMDLQEASKARFDLERGLELDIPLEEIPEEVRDQVLRYNEDDCRATQGLHRWLEELRADLIAKGEEIPRPLVAEKEEKEPEGRRKEQRELMERLLRDIPEDPAQRTPEQQAQWLLGNMIQFHWREEKATWWEYFRMRELSDAEYMDEQTALAGLEFVKSLPIRKGTSRPIHRYSFPAQESKIREEHEVCLGNGEVFKDGFGKIVAVDYAARTVDILKNIAVADIHPTAVFEFSNFPGRAMEDAIFRAGEIVSEDGIESERLQNQQVDLLMGHPPRFRDGFRDPIRLEEEAGLDAALRLVMDLDGGILPIQGPPGTGKTHIGARMACALIATGKTVGVVATSHKVIDNFLNKLEEASAELKVIVRAVHKDSQPNTDGAFVTYLRKSAKVREALSNGDRNTVGGTAWLWALEDFRESVDVLFVDEAGQMSLANVLASAQGARNVVLLGDPQQLDQPQKGSHPEGVEVSALEHLLSGAETMPDDRGLFLEKTWRLSKPICDYTSELFYQSRLTGIEKLKNQAVHAPPLIEMPGLYFLPVEHSGNQSSCEKEAVAIKGVVEALLGATSLRSPLEAPARRSGDAAKSGGGLASDEVGRQPGGGPPLPEQARGSTVSAFELRRSGSQGETRVGGTTSGDTHTNTPTWTDRDGQTHHLTLNDILIVAPYNAQVSDIAAKLPEGARVGTVDKFQGQEAPIVIYSMTTSSREDAPRGMEFLYSLHRLNVATSRAKCACILVANPAVLAPDCRTPKQMRLANAFCSYVERAHAIDAATLYPV